MTSITVRVPDWMKAEMDRHRDINWAEVIRSCIRMKLAQFKQPAVIDELVEKYLKQGDEIKLRTLDLFAELLNVYYILDNIRIMYGDETTNKAQEALDELKNLGIEKPYDKIGNIEAREAIFYVFDEKGVYSLFEEKILREISHADDCIKDAVWLLSQYDYRIVPDGFERTFKILHPDFSGDVLNELVKIGILYKDYYDSRAYSHWWFKVPSYARLLLEEVAKGREEFVRENLKKLIKAEWFKDFLKWMGSTTKWIIVYEEEKVKTEYKELYGKDLDEVLSILVKEGILIIDYDPRRRRAGRRKSQPSYWILRITPTASKVMSFDILFNII